MPHWEDRTPPREGCFGVLALWCGLGFSALYLAAQVVRVVL